MKHTKIVLFFLILLLAILSLSIVSGQEEPVSDDSLLLSLVPYTESMIISSPTNEQDYVIFVNLPASYNSRADQSYPVLYMFDPHASFSTITAQTWLLPIIDELPEIIVVAVGAPAMQGLGGENAAAALSEVDQLRLQNLLPSQDAESFLGFLTETLIPYIDLSYQTNPADRAIMGHSAGAEFVLYALFNAPGTFHRFVASSPGSGPSYAEEVCIACELEKDADISGVIFLSSGEFDGHNNNTPQYVENGFSILEDYSNENLNLTVTMHIFEDTSHLSVIPYALIRGLQTIYCGSDYIPYSCQMISVKPLVSIEDTDFPSGTVLSNDSVFRLRNDPRYVRGTESCDDLESTVLQVAEDVDGEVWIQLMCGDKIGWIQKDRLED